MDSAFCAPNIKITIGMCVKDCESTIKEAIESVLDQDFAHDFMELVVVDGYSRDKTLRILRDSLKKTGVETKIFYENEGEILFYTERGIRSLMLENSFLFSFGDLFYGKELSQDEISLIKEVFDDLIARKRLRKY